MFCCIENVCRTRTVIGLDADGIIQCRHVCVTDMDIGRGVNVHAVVVGHEGVAPDGQASHSHLVMAPMLRHNAYRALVSQADGC